jgi:hypothetical protein
MIWQQDVLFFIPQGLMASGTSNIEDRRATPNLFTLSRIHRYFFS